MEWIIYVSFVFLPVVFIWIMLWAIEKKTPERYRSDNELRGDEEFENLCISLSHKI